MDRAVVSQLKALASEERRITTEILKLLMEVEDRKIFAEMGFPSLYEFCRKELKYSEGAAYRRISAMRLMRGNHEVAEKIESGELSITVASQVHSAFLKLHKAKVTVTAEKRREVVAAVESKSKREVEKFLADQTLVLAPQLADAMNESERIVQLGNGMCRLELTVPESMISEMDQLLAKFSHVVPSGKFLDLIKYLVEGKMAVRKLSESKKGEREELSSNSFTQTHLAGEVKSRQMRPGISQERSGPGNRSINEDKPKRYVSSSVKREVLKRGEGKCSYVNPETGIRCEGKHFIQFDHVVPVALGGNSQANNLRLLCGTHNRLVAEKLGLGRLGVSEF